MRFVAGLCGIAVLALGSGCSRGGDAPTASEAASSGPVAFQEDPGFVSEGVAERAAETYAAQCATCHGAAGDGQGPAAAALEPSPTDFTAQAVSAHRAYVTIESGGMAVGRAALMPGFGGQLDDQAIHDLVAYVRAFAQ